MVITRTPFRVSFFGGGTDYPVWYEKNGGAVLSTTIDKYCWVSARHLPPFFEHKSRIAYSKIELVKQREEIEHPVVRETLGLLGVEGGVEIHNFNDLPARSGMGSSSSFTVGLLHALHVLKGKNPEKEKLAQNAIHVEQNLLKENVGCQDQVAAAFGGFNKITFGGKEHMRVEPIALEEEKLNAFQDRLMLFFTGLSRNSSEIAAHQVKNIPKKTRELRRMREMVDESIAMLRGNDFDGFGRLLHEAWNIKRDLSSEITNSFIDGIYKAGREAGALGGKLLGAGGGGFILFYVPLERKENVKTKLRDFLHIPFRFENKGSEVIYKQT
ncbi:MAG: kinase [Nanoarchaeota archaeon]|nr:kinase [Nanoarchaeota archaeon]